MLSTYSARSMVLSSVALPTCSVRLRCRWSCCLNFSLDGANIFMLADMHKITHLRPGFVWKTERVESSTGRGGKKARGSNWCLVSNENHYKFKEFRGCPSLVGGNKFTLLYITVLQLNNQICEHVGTFGWLFWVLGFF